jgi:hypothetical protein
VGLHRLHPLCPTVQTNMSRKLCWHLLFLPPAKDTAFFFLWLCILSFDVMLPCQVSHKQDCTRKFPVFARCLSQAASLLGRFFVKLLSLWGISIAQLHRNVDNTFSLKHKNEKTIDRWFIM